MELRFFFLNVIITTREGVANLNTTNSNTTNTTNTSLFQILLAVEAPAIGTTHSPVDQQDIMMDRLLRVKVNTRKYFQMTFKQKELFSSDI